MSYRQMVDTVFKYEYVLPILCDLFQALQREDGRRAVVLVSSKFRFEAENSHAWAIAKDSFERDHYVKVGFVHIPERGFCLEAVRS